MKFKSKIAWGLFLPLLVIMSAFTILFVSQQEYTSSLILLFAIVLILIIIFNTYYEITGEYVFISSAFIIKKRILIKDILRITENRNIISAPATSFDRIYLETTTGKTNISPEDKSLFIHLLLEINDKIVVTRMPSN